MKHFFILLIVSMLCFWNMTLTREVVRLKANIELITKATESNTRSIEHAAGALESHNQAINAHTRMIERLAGIR